MATAQNEPVATDHWKDQVLNTLQSLPSTTPPDCCVIVATKRIPAHKTALQLNSTLLSAGDASYNKDSDLIEIELLQEFSEQDELISEIVGSFYTGTINVTKQNMLMLYKFAKSYSVQWLMDYVRPILVESITEDQGCETFVDVFKFAHSVWCTDLFDTCIEVLDDALLEKILNSEGALSLGKLDYFCVKTITSSEKLCVAEKGVFQLVTAWCKEETSRCQHLGSLLEIVQYHLIDRSYLSDNVFNFVLDTPDLEDVPRRVLLKTINTTMKLVQGHSSRSIGKSESQNKSLIPYHQDVSPDNDECLRKIGLIMSGKEVSTEDQNISDDELNVVITEKFKYMKDDVREIFINYLGSKERVNSSNIVACLQLFDVYRSPRILWLYLDKVAKNNSSNSILYDVEWNKVSFDTVSAIVTNVAIKDHLLKYDLNLIIIGSKSNFFNRFEGCSQIELIMLWALAHPNEVVDIRKLLKTICYRKIPPEYLKLILLPCVQKIIPDITELECQPHSHDGMEPVKEMIFGRAPADIYFLRRFKEEYIVADRKYILELEASKLVVYSFLLDPNTNGYGVCKFHNFILFDAANPCRFNYPIFTRELPLSLVERFVESAVDLCFIYWPRL